MDPKLIREEAIERTNRFFWDNHGVVPSEDSEEWEAEYRRQFALLKAQPSAGAASLPVREPAEETTAAPPSGEDWVTLTGEPTQIRWAAALRAERLRLIRDPGMRAWLATTWTRAKSWIDTRDLPTPVFVQRIAPHYQEYRARCAQEMRLRAERQAAREREIMELRQQVAEAGISVEGLIELIDVCDRLPPVPLRAKLAELEHEGRNLRIFATDDPALLMVLEKDRNTRSDYAIERDAGLVADLDLWMRATAQP